MADALAYACTVQIGRAPRAQRTVPEPQDLAPYNARGQTRDPRLHSAALMLPHFSALQLHTDEASCLSHSVRPAPVLAAHVVEIVLQADARRRQSPGRAEQRKQSGQWQLVQRVRA